MQRVTSAGLCGTGSPARRANSAIRAGMSPGGSSVWSSMSTTVRSAGSSDAAASSPARSASSPASVQVRIDSLSTHNPMMFLR